MNFWRTQDKKEIDFIVHAEASKHAYEVKYSPQKVNFEPFLESYPEFIGKVLHRENIFEEIIAL